MDGKGKDSSALKARFNELGLQNARERPKEHKEAAKAEKEESGKTKETAKDGKQEDSSSEKGKKKKKDKGKGEEAGAEGDSASKKPEKDNPVGILKTSPKGDKAETNGKQETVNSEVQTVPMQAVVVEKAGYIGKHGRGEVRFFNGVPVVYKFAGSNAEPLNAEAVSRHHFLRLYDLLYFAWLKQMTSFANLFKFQGCHDHEGSIQI